MPAGSVILFPAGFVEESAEGACAVLVKERESLPDGIWLKVRCLGTEVKEVYADTAKFFKKGRVYVHLCYGERGSCPLLEEEGCHIDSFDWFPPGSFDAKWLSSSARKAVKDGPKMAAEEKTATAAAGPPRTAFTTLEDRLKRLKEARHVTFAGDQAPSRRPAGGGNLETSRGGTGLGRAGHLSAPLALTDTRKVKEEAIPIESDSDKPKKKKKKKKAKDVEDRLARAVSDRRRREEKAVKKRSRSRSRRGRRHGKRKHRHRSDSRSRSGESRSRESSSSSASLVPPLKKKSQKEPGSVLRLLESQVVEHLAQEGVLEEIAATC